MAAEKYFPFRSVSGDRKYSAEDWAAYFALFLSDGVCYSSADRLKVVVNEGMKVKVMPGAGFIAGRMYMLETDKIITLDTADGALNRIDRIVLRCDYTSRKITTEVVKGSYSERPTAPALNRNSDIYELALADVYVAAGVISIMQSNITDQRLNTGLCGIVTGLIDQADTTDIFNQFTAYLEEFKQTSGGNFDTQLNEWDTEFNTWFAEIRAALEGDIATELADRILKLEDGTTTAGNAKTVYGLKVTGELITPENSGHSTLLEYVRALNEQHIHKAVFACGGFPDLPRTDWTYTVEMVASGTIYVEAEMHLSNGVKYTREVGYDNLWIDEWRNSADSGNANTVNGYHAYEFQPVDQEGHRFLDIKAYLEWQSSGVHAGNMKWRADNANGETYRTMVDNADTIDGLHATTDGKTGVPVIGSDYGALEIGSIIDFHTEDGQDFKTRLFVDQNSGRLAFITEDGAINSHIAVSADLANYFHLNNNEIVKGIPTFAGGVGNNEGGEIHLAKPESSTEFNGDVVLDVLNNMVRVLAIHGGVVKQLQIDFNSLTGGNDTVLHTGNSAKVTITDSENDVPDVMEGLWAY